MFINAYNTADKSNPCSNIIDNKLVLMRSNWRIYIPAHENPKTKEPETQSSIESLESKNRIKDL